MRAQDVAEYGTDVTVERLGRSIPSHGGRIDLENMAQLLHHEISARSPPVILGRVHDGELPLRKRQPAYHLPVPFAEVILMPARGSNG